MDRCTGCSVIEWRMFPYRKAVNITTIITIKTCTDEKEWMLELVTTGWELILSSQKLIN